MIKQQMSRSKKLQHDSPLRFASLLQQESHVLMLSQHPKRCPTSQSYSNVDISKGDCDGDGVVGVMDGSAVRILQQVSRSMTPGTQQMSPPRFTFVPQQESHVLTLSQQPAKYPATQSYSSMEVGCFVVVVEGALEGDTEGEVMG